MEPLVALAFAANILQFIDWISHVLDVGNQIRRDGISDFNMGLDRTANELTYQIQRIKPQREHLTCQNQTDQALDTLAMECHKVAEELLEFIARFKLKPGENRSKIKTLGQAIELSWKKDKVKQLSTKLDQYRMLLYSEVALGIRDTVMQSLQRLEDLTHSQSENQGALMDNLARGHANLTRLLQTHSTSLLEQITVNENAAKERHVEILSTINGFSEAITSKQLFPVLPKPIIDADPSLSYAAMNGHATIENHLLEALTFRLMYLREDEIHDTYKQTFEWIFDDNIIDEKPWSPLITWLRQGNGSYWIGGKAGSGKSTLMKMISCAEQTKKALVEWSGAHQLITGSYFFWKAGTDLQKNQEGLLRSLLYTVLKQRRDLISRVFPKLYAASMFSAFAENDSPLVFFSCDMSGCTSSFPRPQELRTHRMTKHLDRLKSLGSNSEQNEGQEIDAANDLSGHLRLAELKAAFTLLSLQEPRDFRICFFVDGLDEFSGDHQEIVDLFKHIASTSSTIKLVVSSRPEPIFVEAFRKSDNLLLEYLTQRDIRRYIQEKLYSHSRIQQLESRRSSAAGKLIDAVVNKASGVFLWVVLVVRSLLNGLSEGIYIDELERVVFGYPRELHELYSHMFARMKPEYKAQASKLFHYVFCAIEVENAPPSAVRLSFMDKDSPAMALNMPVGAISCEELDDRILSIEDRLRSRCFGLFEVHRPPHTKFDSTVNEGKVTLLHRSVLDFWQDPAVQSNFLLGGEDHRFEPSEGLYASILFQIKASFQITRANEWNALLPMIQSYLAHCQRCASNHGRFDSTYVEELDRVLTYVWNHPKWSSIRKSVQSSEGDGWCEATLRVLDLKIIPKPEKTPLLLLSAHYGLSEYVQDCVKNASLFQGEPIEQSLLTRLIAWLLCSDSAELRLHYIHIIEMLLRSGFDINAKSDSETKLWRRSAWEVLIYITPLSIHCASFPATGNFKTKQTIYMNDMPRFIDWVKVVKKFIEMGAKLDISYEGTLRNRTARNLITERLALSAQQREYLSVEDIRCVEDARTSIEQLLAEVTARKSPKHSGRAYPRLRQLTSRYARFEGGVSLQSSNEEVNESKGRKRKAVSHKTTSDQQKASTPALPIRTVSAAPCVRCHCIETLAEIGFARKDAMHAIENAGVGNDVQALTVWLTDRARTSQQHDPASQSRPFPDAQPRDLVSQSHTDLKATGQSWSTVAKKAPSPTPRPQVVGAKLVCKSPKQRHRRTPESPSPSPSSKQSKDKNDIVNAKCLSVGTLKLESGRFAYSFEPQGQRRGLERHDIDMLQRFLNSILADG